MQDSEQKYQFHSFMSIDILITYGPITSMTKGEGQLMTSHISLSNTTETLTNWSITIRLHHLAFFTSNRTATSFTRPGHLAHFV